MPGIIIIAGSNISGGDRQVLKPSVEPGGGSMSSGQISCQRQFPSNGFEKDFVRDMGRRQVAAGNVRVPLTRASSLMMEVLSAATLSTSLLVDFINDAI